MCELPVRMLRTPVVYPELKKIFSSRVRVRRVGRISMQLPLNCKL